MKGSILSSSYSGDSLSILEENFCSEEDDIDCESSNAYFRHGRAGMNTGGEDSKQNDRLGEKGDRSEAEEVDGTMVLVSDLRKDRGNSLGKDNTIFDEALKVVWETKRNFHQKGNTPSDPISEPSCSVSKVGEIITTPVGTTSILWPKNMDESVEKDSINYLGKLTKTKSVGDLCGPIQSTKSRPRKIKYKHKLVGPVLEKEKNNIEDPSAEFTLPTLAPIVVFQGEIPTESDILRCNHRILSNFYFSGVEKLQIFISKLGVVYGDSKRDVANKFDDLKRVVINRMEG